MEYTQHYLNKSYKIKQLLLATTTNGEENLEPDEGFCEQNTKAEYFGHYIVETERTITYSMFMECVGIPKTKFPTKAHHCYSLIHLEAKRNLCEPR